MSIGSLDVVKPIQNSIDMFRNYFKTGIRNLLKYKTFSFINIFGLAIAMSVCMLVILMLADEKSYDQFHSNKHRIFRILSERPYSSRPFASTPPTLAETFRNDYAVVEKATSLVIGVGGDAVSDYSTAEMRGFFADENFLQVFDYELEHGDKDQSLDAPNSIILTHSLSQKLFRNDNPVGQTIEFFDRGLHYLRAGKDSPPVSWGRFTITGVIADKKYKSHLKFDALVSSSSQKHLTGVNYADDPDSWDKSFTYVLLREGKTIDELNSALSDLFKRRYSNVESLKGFRVTAQPLMKINPGIMVNQPPSFQLPIEFFYFLGFIAFAILLSACLNYTNLSTARALTRAKEIGVRKVTGAHRRDLVVQFISESVVTSFLALFLATLLLIVIKPAFTGLWLNRYLNFDLDYNMSVYFIFGAFALVLGILAGLYPAVHLSAFQPVRAIKNSGNVPAGKLSLRKILSVSQFVISLFFVITSIVIYAQFKYFMNFQYGFNPTNIVNIELQGNSFNKISQVFSSVPGIADISASEYVPGTGRTSGMDIFKPGTQETVNFRLLSVNETFAGNLELDFVAGRNLPLATDSSGQYIVINETAVKAMGFASPESIVGQVLIQPWKNESLEVVGVVKDFWLRLPIGGDPIEPAFMRYQEKNFSFANVKISSSDIPATIKRLEDKWNIVDSSHPFKYQFYENELASTHAGIFDVVSIIGFLAFIAITIACLGMLGMATYTAERKRKEVGIRKVLGAQTLSIAFLLSRDFLKILAIAILIGAPLAWFINNLWLQNFANRAEFGFGTVFLGTLILLALGLITIGSQTISVSKTNPVETLKSE
jgi:putative ABC transport system permease protein